MKELLKTVDQMPGETVVAVIGDHGEHLGRLGNLRMYHVYPDPCVI